MLDQFLTVSPTTTPAEWAAFATWFDGFIRDALSTHGHLEEQLRTRDEECEENTEPEYDQGLSVNASWAEEVLARHRVHLVVVAQLRRALLARDLTAVPRLTREVLVDDLLCWAEEAKAPIATALLQWHHTRLPRLADLVPELYLTARMPVSMNFAMFAAAFTPEPRPGTAAERLTFADCRLHTGRPRALLDAGIPEDRLWTVVTAGAEAWLESGVRWEDSYAYVVTARPHDHSPVTVYLA